MEKGNQYRVESSNRRQRLHELVIALIQRQDNLELMDSDELRLDRVSNSNEEDDSARWLNKNRRIIRKYQSLIRSAITLDALMDAEQSSSS